MPVCYLALGSNIQPVEHLRQTVQLLKALPNLALVAVSPCYETAPWGMTEQAAFLNLVIKGAWQGDALSLLAACQQIEQTLNRVRVVKNGPRTIDIDILLFGAAPFRHDHLTIPHPGLYERDFMLVPLLDVAPDALDPISGVPLQQLRNNLLYHCIRHPVEVTLGE